MVAAGSKAPAFSLPDQHGKTLRLADLKGHWLVLYFYPRDDTPGCTTEACEFTSELHAFAACDAKVIGVSPDAPETHAKFIAKHKLGIDLLSDPEHTVLTKYGAFGEKTMYGKKVQGVIRSTFLIDRDGKVAHAWPRVVAKGHAAQVLAKLRQLQETEGSTD